MKALVEVKIATPIKKGINIGSQKDGLTWIDFKYEHLPTFCYLCGLVGHNEGSCDRAKGEQSEGSNSPKGWGPWLRANQVGVRVEEKKEGMGGRGKREQRDNPLNAKLTEKLLEKLVSLIVAKFKGTDTEEGPNQSPTIAALEFPSAKGDSKEATKKGKAKTTNLQEHTGKSPRGNEKENRPPKPEATLTQRSS